MSKPSAAVIAERNRRLMEWMATALKLADQERAALESEMAMIFDYATDQELAEYLWEKLSSKNVISDIKSARQIIQHKQAQAERSLSNPDTAGV